MSQKKLLKLSALMLLVVVIIFSIVNFRDELGLQHIQQIIQEAGIWAPLAFIGLYATATVLFLPGSALTLAGGLIFGPFYGTLYNMVGAMVGAAIAFVLARYTASDWVASKTGGKLKQLIDGVEQEGWRFVAVVRLVPVLPFNLLNYALGLTKISFVAYAIASIIFMLPGCFAYTYLGSLGEAAISGNTAGLVTKVSIAIGLLILVACIPWLIKKWRSPA